MPSSIAKSFHAAFLLLPALLSAQQVASIDVGESAGLRRFGYPVRARIHTALPPEALMLVEDGKPVAAQFTRMDDGGVEVDWAASLGPGEQRQFRVEKGAAPPVASPMSVEQTAASYIVHYPGGLAFHVPKNLGGLLEAVRTNETGYVSPGSVGLVLMGRDNIERRLVASSSRVLKSGPLACALRFESTEQLPHNRLVKSIVEMEFPASKSWVEVRWMVDDPHAMVNSLLADVNLRVDGQPLIVDFGAGSTVYATVRAGQSAKMSANAAAWRIDVNGENYAAGREQRAEGWAHMMDRVRATAIGVADFTSRDATVEASIETQAGGRLRIRRDHLDGPRKSLAFWLHFVSTPVQIGAVTSPQSMLHPLSVHVE